jgi:outer membrane biosynthesis protein TonB
MKAVIPIAVLFGLACAASPPTPLVPTTPDVAGCVSQPSDSLIAALSASQHAKGYSLDEGLIRQNDPPVRFPPQLRILGIPGYVDIQYVVRETGVVDPCTIRILHYSHYDFIEPAVRLIIDSRFTPGRKAGAIVPVLTQQRIMFTIS